ncbi:PRC-barrel domain-containing protein, partial [Pontibaca methylaminivorans]|uniref:PRC-barrel domain-containing protein n=1 Tax=Pontibaca methylaminivorans TaxID=515897 RepID=UPI002FDB320C
GSKLIGHKVYARDGGFSDEDAATLSARDDLTDAPDDWQELGDIDDLLITAEGQVDGVVIDVGGFFDLDDHDVRVPMEDLSLVRDSDSEDDFFVIYRADPAPLSESRKVDWDQVFSENGRTEEGLQEADIADYEASDIEGAPVFGADEDKIGDVKDLVLDEEGGIKTVVVDVGGFLGIGAKPVALDLDQIRLMTSVEDQNDNTPRLYVDMSKEQLEELPEYQE